MDCLRCKKPSGKSMYCRECRKLRDNALAIVSQNKSKLIRLLKLREINEEQFIKFNLYTEHIKTNGLTYLQFKQLKTYTLFKKLVNSATVIVCMISLKFAFEIYLVS